ncbi:hypothetical protein Dsin_006777 [Dipteronia sinensis]|uniref:Reverse transcriptase zinc-binding domain-containing protein n=1 Tax=Dipteronia sinensis TaxID=43782 RepID=A0AAE0EHS4_9ROSI|nr:hypothetical protein Dsin_006777 [Dipteronia sinensis]
MVDSVPVKASFPIIFALSLCKEGCIADFGQWHDKKWVWDMSLRRQPFDWEMNQWNCFLKCTECVVIRRSINDTMDWCFTLNGIFSVSSFRCAIEDFQIFKAMFSKHPWKRICPAKVEVFLWQLLSGKFLLGDVLQKFGLGMDLNCKLCKNDNVTINYVFLLCPWTWKL